MMRTMANGYEHGKNGLTASSALSAGKKDVSPTARAGSAANDPDHHVWAQNLPVEHLSHDPHFAVCVVLGPCCVLWQLEP